MVGDGEHAHKIANLRRERADLELPFGEVFPVAADRPVDAPGDRRQTAAGMPGVVAQGSVEDRGILPGVARHRAHPPGEPGGGAAGGRRAA